MDTLAHLPFTGLLPKLPHVTSNTFIMQKESEVPGKNSSEKSKAVAFWDWDWVEKENVIFPYETFRPI